MSTVFQERLSLASLAQIPLGRYITARHDTLSNPCILGTGKINVVIVEFGLWSASGSDTRNCAQSYLINGPAMHFLCVSAGLEPWM